MRLDHLFQILALLPVHKYNVLCPVSTVEMFSFSYQKLLINLFPFSLLCHQNLNSLWFLQALTSASANDIMNLERMETLGDSFLKLISSLYLFKHHKRMNEGELTCIKGRHIGNCNLYYCGVKRRLGGLMKVCCGYTFFCK